MPATSARTLDNVICAACGERRHQDCRGGTWCDCQHLPPERPVEPATGHPSP